MQYTSNIKANKEFGLAKTITYNLVLSIFLTLAVAVICIYAFGLRLDVVLSDSMSPEFYKDDIVVIRAYDDYKIGDIIEFKMSATSEPVTHRIINKTGTGKNVIYETHGDANPEDSIEYVPHSKVNGKVISIIKNGNLIYQFFKTNYFLFIDIILGIWVLSSTLSSEIEMRKHNIAKAE